MSSVEVINVHLDIRNLVDMTFMQQAAGREVHPTATLYFRALIALILIFTPRTQNLCGEVRNMVFLLRENRKNEVPLCRSFLDLYTPIDVVPNFSTP